MPVGCVPLAVIHPPLVGHGWLALYGCCTFAAYHRDLANAINEKGRPVAFAGRFAGGVPS